MPELFTVLSPNDALKKLFDHMPTSITIEAIETANGLQRVLAESPIAMMPLPSFPRSTMDGYAVRAADTFGASEALPAYLKVIGESPMGRAPSIELNASQTAIIHTGGMMPSGADAVVMIERTQKVTEAEIEVLRAVAPGENVLQVGEDVKPNELLLPIGHVLRPQDLGGLMAIGLTSIKVARRPRVGILATGDEVIDPHTVPQAGQVRDVNTYTLKGMIERSGCVAQSGGIIRDDFDHLVQAARSLIDQCDALVLSAGSSVSVRDMTSDVINQLGQPGVLVHGVSIKPGKPTILAVCNGKPVFGLPGNPVSALVVGDLFITPTLWRMQGCDQSPTRQAVQARLAHNLSSVPGRVDYIQVKLIERAGETWAEPIFGKSNLIYTLVKSDGMLIIPINATGLQASELVEVRLF